MPTRPHPFWEIYSVKNHSWKRLDLHDMLIGIGLTVYLNGLCHWWAFTYDEDNRYMISFNLSNEMFFTTLLPLDLQDRYHDEWVVWGSRYLDLVVLNGFVAMISKHVKTSSFHIYVLGELGVRESWTKLFIVGPLPSVRCPIGVGKKGDLFFITDDDELACFDLNTQIIEDLDVKGESFDCDSPIYTKKFLPIGRKSS